MTIDPNAPNVDPLVGKTLANQYLIEALIARGGMGNIYLARQQPSNSVVAIKVLRREFSDDGKVIKRFIREALAVSQLKHPHTAQIFDSGETPDGIQYIVMEYLEGVSLDRRIAGDRQLPAAVAATFVAQTAASLAEAHGKGIVHRDLKPANVFIVSRPGMPDFVKVLDFGIAKVHLGRGGGNELTKLTAAGSTMGTPHYMAPEQIRGEEVDARADIYSLGVILWECIVGRPPFLGDSPMEIFIGHLEHKVPKFATVAPQIQVPSGLEEIVRKALAKKPKDRFASAQDFAAALEPFVGPVPSMASQRIRHSDLALPPVMRQQDTQLNTRTFARRARFWVGTSLAALAALVVLSLILFTVLHSREDTATPPPPKAVVKFFSEPNGAEVLQGAQLHGVTPFVLELAEPRLANFELRASGFASFRADLAPDPKEVRGLVVALDDGAKPSDADGSLSVWIETDPAGASVSIDGRALEQRSPCRVKIPARGAPVELLLELEGFLPERYLAFGPSGVTLVMATKLVAPN